MATKELMSPNMIERYWDKFYKANNVQAKAYSDEAVQWFKNRVSKDLKVHADKIINANSDYKKRNAKQAKNLAGKLFTYEYAAETAGGDHGYYDRYPMVFFFDTFRSKEGKLILLGLNVHYLTPTQRANLYKHLMKLKNTKGITEKTRLRLEWESIVAYAGQKICETAVHAYRADRVQSQLVEIPPEDFIVATFLRTERWVKPISADPAIQSYVRKLIRKK